MSDEWKKEVGKMWEKRIADRKYSLNICLHLMNTDQTECYYCSIEKKVDQLRREVKELNDRIFINEKKSMTERTKLSFGEAVGLLVKKDAEKIGCWHRDDIFVYLDVVNDHAHLFIHTTNGHQIPWTPNNFEILKSSWRVIE